MRLLLDTHIFLWLISDDPRLSLAWRALIADRSNLVYLSAVSLWETLVKHSLGKLPLPAPPMSYLTVARERHQISPLALDESSLRPLVSLPQAHRDPFDRMLVCQALEHGLTIVTVDPVFAAYPAPLASR